jgi:hypothetical protein
MQINPLQHRTRSNPTAGVKFSRDEQAHTRAAADVLRDLDYIDQDVLRNALSRYAMHLEELADWTADGNEEIRRGEYETALVLFEAVRSAKVGRRFGAQS